MHFMVKNSLVLVLLILSACSTGEKKHLSDYDTDAGVRIPISVTSFRSGAARTGNSNCKGWWWFDGDLGNAFQELTVDELSSYRRFAVLERKDIHRVYENEVNLVNSSKTTPIEKGQFQKAKYTISGVVNSFEYCAGRSNIGAAATNLVSESLLGGRFDQETATVEVTLRLIDTRTGRVLASKKGQGKQTRTSIKGVGQMKGFATDLKDFSQTSLSSAIREAIQDSVQGLMQQARL